MSKPFLMRVSPVVVFFLLYNTMTVLGQNFNTMSGDWIRIKAEFHDGEKLPGNHFARVYQRYCFSKDQVYQVVGSDNTPAEYTRTGSNLRIAPIQSFIIEQYTNKALTLLEAEGSDPLRYYLIPTDSFKRSGWVKYSYTISNNDTIYNAAVGIEPIYIKGNQELNRSIMQGLSPAVVAFQYTYVVLKDGTIGEVEILSTSDDKKSKRLIQLVKKSSGKWIPATLGGKAINVKIKDNFSLKH